MIAEDDPFVGQICAADAAFDDVVGLEAVVHLDFEMDFHALAAEVILESAVRLARRLERRAVHVFEQRLGVVPGKRQRHDFRRGHGLLDRNALCAGDRGPARGLRVAGDHEIVSDGAALDVIFRAPWAVGIDFAFLVAVFLRIAVNQNRGRAFALRGERFESAIAVGIGVAHEDDFAFDADAVLAQQIVVLGIAAVGVDDGRGDFAGDGHAEPGAADGGIFRVGIGVDRSLAQEA